MPSGTVEVLIDLLEEQEDAIRMVAVHLSTGEDLSASQLEAMLRQRRKSDETFATKVLNGLFQPVKS